MKTKWLIIMNLLWLLSCDIKDNESVNVADSFLRIYDSQNFNASYEPIDIIQTSDGGYLILSGTRQNDTNFLGAHLMKVDENGIFEAQEQLTNGFLHPVDQWLVVNDAYYFICMDGFTQAQLIRVGESLEVSDPVGLGITYPMHASVSGNNILVLGYSNQSQSTVLALFNENGQIQNSQGFFIGAGEEVEEPIIDHFNRTGNQLPFFAGTLADNTYYFNGFFNFTMSLVFTDLSGPEPNGVVQGQQDDGAFSAVVPLEGNRFSAARFNFGDNFYLPDVNLDRTGTTSASDLGGIPNLELVDNAPVTMESITIAQEAVTVFGSNTRNGQILLTAYSQETGALLGLKYIGFANPYEIADIVPTADNGMAILAKTFISGRFARVCLIKLSENEVVSLLD
jgi:hypothetical protein